MRYGQPLRAALLATAAIVTTGTAHGQETAEGSVVVLDEITVVPSRIEETVTQSPSATSVVSERDLERLQPATPGEIFVGMPGVTATSDGNPTSTNINIRGLQDAGRVAVIVDGARRNFQINGHRNGTPQWIEPEMLKSVTVVRGPVSNIYGSGAIGGVVAFETKTASDFLRPEEMAAGSIKTGYQSNRDGFLASATGAVRLTQDIDVIGNIVYREQNDYRDGNDDAVPGTGFDILGGLVKTSIRPTDHSELTLGWLGDRQDWTSSGRDIDTELEQDTFTLSYAHNGGGVDLKVNGYVNKTTLRQTRLVDGELFLRYDPVPFPPPGSLVPVYADLPAGTTTRYDVETAGFDIHNTTRFATGAFRHTLTYGGDWFRDDVETKDTAGIADAFNPSGKRTASGAFIQNRIEYADWLEIRAGLRYDRYDLDSPEAKASGDRLSPRITVGVKPFEQTDFHGIRIYGTYAEGYRAPSIGETLITGIHPTQFAPFSFLPNPNLRPETAKTFEVGVNVERDHLFVAGDGLRIKASLFHNDVDDYIGLSGIYAADDPSCAAVPGIVIPGGPPFPVPWTGFDCYQYSNISKARLRGFEFEGIYDTGTVFAGLRGHIIRGDNREAHEPLRTVPADQLTVLAGFRMLDGKLTLGGETQFVASQKRVPAGVEPTDSYTLVNLFASYEPTENFRLDARLENLFDKAYRDHLNPSLGFYREPGFNAKIAATVRIGVEGRGIFDQ